MDLLLEKFKSFNIIPNEIVVVSHCEQRQKQWMFDLQKSLLYIQGK